MKKFFSRRLISKEIEKEGIGGIQQLSEDILLDILCRIRTLELIQVCKCVCKAWLELLEHALCSPSFINSNCAPSAIVHGDWPYKFNIAKLKENHSFLPSAPFGLNDERFEGLICATSDGVLLIELWDDCNFVVLNPLTMQSLNLPRLDHHVERFGAITRSPKSGKFMVLAYGQCMCEDASTTWVWHTLTVSTNMSWKILSDLPPACNPTDSRTPDEFDQLSINGIIYVRFIDDGEGNDDDELTFAAIDLHNETAYSLKIPDAEFHNETTEDSLEVPVTLRSTWMLIQVGNDVGFAKNKRNTSIDIWVLKDLSRNEWTFTLRFGLLNLPKANEVLNLKPRIWFQSSQAMVIDVDMKGRNFDCLAYFVKERKFQRLDFKTFDYFMYGVSLARLF